jgi:hypothetical protein
MRPILWLDHSSIVAAGRLNARNSPFIGTSEHHYYPLAQAICRVISTDLKLAPAQSGALFVIVSTHANPAEHLPEEGAVPVGRGRAPHRRALRRPAKALPLRPLPHVPPDQPNQGKTRAAPAGGGMTPKASWLQSNVGLFCISYVMTTFDPLRSLAEWAAFRPTRTLADWESDGASQAIC